MLSPHHHHHHHPQQPHEHSPDRHSDHRRRLGLGRRKSVPNESRRGPLAPVLDHLEKSNSVPIHLHISQTGDLSITRKGSSSSYSCSEIAPDESKSLADVHQHIPAEEQQQQPKPDQPEPQPQLPPQIQIQTEEPVEPEPEPEPPQPDPQPAMAVSEPPPLSPQHSDDGEQTPNPFLVDDPEDPLSEPASPIPAPVPPLPLDPVTLPLEVPPVEPVALTPAQTELPLLPDPEPAPPPVDKPVPALPVSSETESETGDEPAVHLPQLVMPTMFLPIPNVRMSSPLTWWLTRHTPIYY